MAAIPTSTRPTRISVLLPRPRAHSAGRKQPASATEYHLAQSQRPCNSVFGLGENSRDIHHRHKKKHHDAEQQARPLHLNFCGNAQGRGQQRKADEVGPEQMPRHIRGHAHLDEFCGREVLRAEDRQGQGETQIAQGDDFVEAAGLRDIGLRSPQCDREKQDGGGAHGGRRGREIKKREENDWVHGDVMHMIAPQIVLLEK